jgi:pentatricopeptide repeat protein
MREISGAVKYYNLLVNEYKLVPDVITLNTIINIHAQVGNIEGAVYYYNQFYKFNIEPDLVTMNAMINAYAQAGNVAGAVEQYNQIQSGINIFYTISRY